MVMMMMTTINHFLPQPRTPYSSQQVGTQLLQKTQSCPAVQGNGIMAQVIG